MMNLRHRECGGAAHFRQSSAASRESSTTSKPNTPETLSTSLSNTVHHLSKEEDLTVRHAHAHVVDLLPVLEGLPDCTLTTILLGIMVVLQEVADEELVLGLCTEQEAEADRVEQTPSEGVHEVQRERVRGEDRKCDRVEQDEDELEVGCAGR